LFIDRAGPLVYVTMRLQEICEIIASWTLTENVL